MDSSVRKPVGMLGPDTLAMVRRATAKALEILRADSGQPNPIGKLALHVAVEKNIIDLVMAGERDESRLCKGALAVVLGARSPVDVGLSIGRAARA